MQIMGRNLSSWTILNNSVNANKLKNRNRAFIVAAKNKPCMDCGNMYDSWIMEFDHRESSITNKNIGQMLTNSLSRVQREIDLCDIICSNCHKIRTYFKAQWFQQPAYNSKALKSTRYSEVLARNTEIKLAAKSQSCKDCKLNYPPYVLDFDHRDRSTKRFCVGSAVTCAVDVLLDEISRCDIVCSNCHRTRSYIRGDQVFNV